MFHIVTLFKGSLLHGLSIEMGEEKIRKHKEGLDNFKEDKDLKMKISVIAILSLG